MNDSDKVTMTINIGGQQLLLSVPFNRQNAVRDTESAVDSLYRSWKRRYPEKNDRELLAMLTYQFATYYHDLQEGLDRATSLAEDCLSRVETALPKDVDSRK